jgi:hypothetical protein
VGGDGSCNVYGYLDQALRIVGHLKTMSATAESFETIEQEMNADRPLGVRIAWAGGGAHFVAVGGYRYLPAQYVHVEDPWYGPSDVAYNTLSGAYQGSGTWTHTYWTTP